MEIDKEYLKEVWNSVWEAGLTELEVQKRYFTKLNKELKGEDRFHLIAIERKIGELEIEVPFKDLLVERMKGYDKNNKSTGLQDFRTEGDGTEWMIEKDEDGNLSKRALGSNEKIYIENKLYEKKK